MKMTEKPGKPRGTIGPFLSLNLAVIPISEVQGARRLAELRRKQRQGGKRCRGRRSDRVPSGSVRATQRTGRSSQWGRARERWRERVCGKKTMSSKLVLSAAPGNRLVCQLVKTSLKEKNTRPGFPGRAKENVAPHKMESRLSIHFDDLLPFFESCSPLRAPRW